MSLDIFGLTGDLRFGDFFAKVLFELLPNDFDLLLTVGVLVALNFGRDLCDLVDLNFRGDLGDLVDSTFEGDLNDLVDLDSEGDSDDFAVCFFITCCLVVPNRREIHIARAAIIKIRAIRKTTTIINVELIPFDVGGLVVVVFSGSGDKSPRFGLVGEVMLNSSYRCCVSNFGTKLNLLQLLGSASMTSTYHMFEKNQNSLPSA